MCVFFPTDKTGAAGQDEDYQPSLPSDSGNNVEKLQPTEEGDGQQIVVTPVCHVLSPFIQQSLC